MTYFDDEIKHRLLKDEDFVARTGISSIEELVEYTEIAINTVYGLKEYCWRMFREKNTSFDKALMGIYDNPDDVLVQLAKIWKSKDTGVLDELKTSNEWIILTSIACRPDCPSEILDYMAKNIRNGYEYVLKVIGRNINTRRDTLELIVNNPSIEYRFRQPAIINLRDGVTKANELM